MHFGGSLTDISNSFVYYSIFLGILVFLTGISPIHTWQKGPAQVIFKDLCSIQIINVEVLVPTIACLGYKFTFS